MHDGVTCRGSLGDAVARRLVGALESSGYRLAVLGLTSGEERTPWESALVSKGRIARLPEPLQTFLRAFYIGETVDATRLRDALGASLCEALERSGLIIRDRDHASLGGRVLRVFSGLYLLGDLWYPGMSSPEDLVYLGDDSYLLGRALDGRPDEDVLDLGTGTGVQGLLLARRGCGVVATDVNPRAVELARQNAALNGLSSRMDVRCGSFFEPVGGESFDRIVLDPPFLPFPADLEGGSTFAGGGASGLEPTWEALECAPRHLKPEGELLVFAGGFGGRGGPACLSDLDRWSRANGFASVVVLRSYSKASDYLREMSERFPSMEAGLRVVRDTLREQKLSVYHNFFFTARRRSTPGVTLVAASKTFGDLVDEARAAGAVGRTP